MQIWIYFVPGAGGDGFANLLEYADNVETLDSNQDPKRWRVHRFVDDQPKFYSSPVDNIRCFRNNRPFLLSENQLRPNYVRLIENGIPTVCTSHDVTKKYLHSSDSRDILEHDQVSVLLYHDNYRLCVYQAALKNLMTRIPVVSDDHCHAIKQKIDHDQFDFVLNIVDLQSDWRVVDEFCNSVGLKLAKERFDDYSKLQAGNDSCCKHNNFRHKRYRSNTVDDNTFYTEI